MEELPRTLEEAVTFIVAALDNGSKERLRAIPAKELILLHHGWGTGIRNELGLWGKNRELLADCGSPDMHADDASMLVMRAVWNRLQGLPIADSRIENYRHPDETCRELGPDELYRRLRFNAAGKRNKEQNVYGMLHQYFGLSYREFKSLAARIDAEDRHSEPEKQ